MKTSQRLTTPMTLPIQQSAKPFVEIPLVVAIGACTGRSASSTMPAPLQAPALFAPAAPPFRISPSAMPERTASTPSFWAAGHLRTSTLHLSSWSPLTGLAPHQWTNSPFPECVQQLRFSGHGYFIVGDMTTNTKKAVTVLNLT